MFGKARPRVLYSQDRLAFARDFKAQVMRTDYFLKVILKIWLVITGFTVFVYDFEKAIYQYDFTSFYLERTIAFLSSV